VRFQGFSGSWVTVTGSLQSARRRPPSQPGNTTPCNLGIAVDPDLRPVAGADSKEPGAVIEAGADQGIEEIGAVGRSFASHLQQDRPLGYRLVVRISGKSS
jgi:hypothetical protein